MKIVIAGGYGAGKTTLVQTASEIDPLDTDALLTTHSQTVDPDLATGKDSTTVALDYGRITLDTAALLLFGTPGQARFWFMWEPLLRGAVGAVILVNPADVALSFPAIDYIEKRRIPFVVAVNAIHGQQPLTEDQLHDSLRLVDPDTPILDVDARDRDQVIDVLVHLLEGVLHRTRRGTGTRAVRS